MVRLGSQQPSRDFANFLLSAISAGVRIAAPKRTPVEIIETLNKEINAGFTSPILKARLADLGGTVLAGSPATFGKLIAEDTEKC